MKTNFWQRVVTILAVAGVAWSVTTAPAQDPAGASTVPPAAVSTPALQLAYGVPQILQLAQAKVGDATIIAYIKNSGNSYGLSADQIIYLRQQGVSDAVVTVMLSQPRAAVAEATPAQQAIMPTDAGGQVSTVTVAPTVTYVQTIPVTTYYFQPYYYPAYDYGYYPPVSFSFGWYGGGCGNGCRGVGYHGGGYGGGGYYHSSPGGGFHPGGSGGGAQGNPGGRHGGGRR